jgi:DNA-directed RNA polymerase subunit beta'
VAGIDITHGLPRAEEIFEARNPKGQGIMSEVDGVVSAIEEKGIIKKVIIAKEGDKKSTVTYNIPKAVKLFVKEGDSIEEGQIISEGPLNPKDILEYKGVDELKKYIINEIQKIYVPEGAAINDKHVEIIVRQMLSKFTVTSSGDTDFLEGELVDKSKLKEENNRVQAIGGEPAKAKQEILGITKVALNTESFLSAASFQETSKVLVNASIDCKVDVLRNLKENVIIGKLIPAGTGWRGIPEDEVDTNWEEKLEENFDNKKNDEE